MQAPQETNNIISFLKDHWEELSIIAILYKGIDGIIKLVAKRMDRNLSDSVKTIIKPEIEDLEKTIRENEERRIKDRDELMKLLYEIKRDR